MNVSLYETISIKTLMKKMNLLNNAAVKFFFNSKIKIDPEHITMNQKRSGN